jgi:hypothetical protein
LVTAPSCGRRPAQSGALRARPTCMERLERLRMSNSPRRRLAPPPVVRSAIVSDCGLYRYELRRIWDDALPPYISGMLNPSIADGEINDRTIIQNWKRAEAIGCGSLIVWKLGAGRATKPAEWLKMADLVGPDNDTHIRRILIECRERNGIATIRWGAHGSFKESGQGRAEDCFRDRRNIPLPGHHKGRKAEAPAVACYKAKRTPGRAKSQPAPSHCTRNA